MNYKQIPRETETLLEYLDRVREAYRIVQEFETWRASVPSIPGVADGPLITPSGGKGSSRRYHGVRLGEAVLSVLEENPGQAYRAKQIVDILVDGGMTFTSARPDLSVSRCLSRAKKDKRVAKRARGLWQWKPGNLIVQMHCGMCGREAQGEMMERGVWKVECDRCGEYEITPQALANIEEGMAHGDLAAVRDKVRSMAEGGERPVLTTTTLKEWGLPKTRPITEPDHDLPF